jgi:hypothetical protein
MSPIWLDRCNFLLLPFPESNPLVLLEVVTRDVLILSRVHTPHVPANFDCTASPSTLSTYQRLACVTPNVNAR